MKSSTALEIQTQFSDPDRARLRVLVATIDARLSDARLSDGGLSRQPGPTGAALRGGSVTDELTASWSEVVRLLALGRAPEIRECPVCKNEGMRAARLCGYCWAKLPPLPPE